MTNELVTQVVELGLNLLNQRLLTLLALLMSFSLFVWAVYDPKVERIAAATIFALIVFLPFWRIERKKE